MESQLTELRYSLNGISESQLNLLFSQLDRLDSQVILKRLTNRGVTLSSDDLILEGHFSQELVSALSRAFPPPLSFKLEVSSDTSALRSYCGFEWEPKSLLLCGVSLLPFYQMQQMISFDNAWHYLRLLTTTQAGSILKPLLAVKPKGLVSIENRFVEFILPMHRIDFLTKWFEHLLTNEVDLNWLSGSTDQLPAEHLQSIGSVDQSRLPILHTWVERTSSSDNLDFNTLFSRAMIALS